jgi:bis(5'-nucleosyl)-tetraphosphatase (symmetrical)
MARNLLLNVLVAARLYSTSGFRTSVSSIDFFTSRQYRFMTYSKSILGPSLRVTYASPRFCCSVTASVRYTPGRFKQCIDSDDGRQIVVGDVHGCKEEMLTLINALRFKADCDRLIFVGDLVAKGPDSLGCLEVAYSSDSAMVLGNHELKILQIVDAITSGHSMEIASSEHATIARKLLEDRNSKLLHYLRNAPACVSMNNSTVLVVHAGLMPETKPEDNSLATLTTMRSVISCDGVLKPSAKAGDTSWASSWSGPETVVFGHDAARGLQVLSDC